MPPKKRNNSDNSTAKAKDVTGATMRRGSTSKLPTRVQKKKLQVTIPNTDDADDVEVLPKCKDTTDFMRELEKLKQAFQSDRAKRKYESEKESSDSSNSSDSSDDETDKLRQKIKKLNKQVQKLKQKKKCKTSKSHYDLSSSDLSDSEDDAPLLRQQSTAISLRAMAGSDLPSGIRRSIKKGDYVDFNDVLTAISVDSMEGGPAGGNYDKSGGSNENKDGNVIDCIKKLKFWKKEKR